MKSLFKICVCVFSLWIGTSSLVVSMQENSGNEVVNLQKKEKIMPYTDIIRWRYKEIDGVMCKRQYNYTKKQWIGKWEPV